MKSQHPQHPIEPTRSNRATERDSRSEPDQPQANEAIESAESFDIDRKWQFIKARFVDDPSGAVREAEQLAGTVVDRWTQRVRAECDSLRQTGVGDGAEPSTEQLRIKLQRYEAFLERMCGDRSVH